MNKRRHSPITRLTSKITSLLVAFMMPLSQLTWAQSVPTASQLPVGGEIVAGDAMISQNGASMNIEQYTDRAVLDWQSFNIGRDAHVNFNQPSNASVALNNVVGSDPSQIFGHLTANGHVFLTNAAGVYFAPGSSVNVGGLIATTNTISNEDFMAGRYNFFRHGAQGAVINKGAITVDVGSYVALLAPEVRNEGVIIAQMGTVAMAAGEAYQLQFNNQGTLSDVTVSKSDIASLVDNKLAIEAPGGLIIMSAQAANHVQGGIVKNTGTIEASGMVNDGGTVRLIASNSLEVGGTIHADAATGSHGKGGTVLAIADLANTDSTMTFSGTVTAQGGSAGGDGGFVETSGSHFLLDENALVNTQAIAGKTGTWLIDPYDYTINGAAATAIVAALVGSNVEVTTSADTTAYGSNGNNASTGNIVVSSGITSNSTNLLTLTAANAITVSAAISTGALTLTGPGGITLNNDLSTITGMTLNGNLTLGGDITLTSGISDTYSAYTAYVVPGGVTSLTATLVGGAGGQGGNDGGFQGGSAGTVGTLTANFDVTGGQTVYIAPGVGGSTGVSSQGSAAGGAGGTNDFGLGSGGAGGTAGSTGSSGGGGGGGAATILALTNTPTSASALLVAGGGGGGGGSGNNATCPGICGDQSNANYRNDGVMTGQTGYNATNQTPPTAGQDGGSSGGGGGGVLGGVSNISVFNTNEWTGRGGNAGSSGAANSFSTNSLSTSLLSTGNSQNGYAIISYGGGTIDINGTINGAHNLDIVARSSDVSISGAIGGSSALTTVEIIGSQGIELAGGGITTTGAQTYTGPVTLNAITTNVTTTSNGAVTFAGDILKTAGLASNLGLSTGSGNVSLNGQTGTSSNGIGTLDITTTGTTTLSGAVYGTSLTKSGSGKTTISGGLVRTSAGQSYAGILDLGGDTTLTSTGTGDIVLSGAVSNNNQSDLTINAAGGNVTLSGNLAVGTNDRPTPIGDVSITASGTVTMGSSGSPIYADAKSLSITANDANVYANSSSNFSCGTGVSSTGVCLTDSASFTIAAASTLSGPLSGTTTLTKAGAGALTLTGVSTYSGNTTVSAGKLEIAGTGKLGNGSYAGNIAVNGQVRFANSVNQTLSGTMSGTGFINSPGSGVLDITTLSNADHYNLATAYVVPTSDLSGSSSLYGIVPTFGYQLATTAGGGTAISDADPSGTVVLNGKPTVTSAVGNYTISYASGLSLGSERYVLQAGNNLAWAINARPLTVTVSKIYDGSAAFTSGFSLSGMVNSDAAPTLSGGASVASRNAGNYTSLASSTLTQNNSNYTLTGATIDATISQLALGVTVSKTFDGSTSFSRDFQLSGMVSGDSTPTITGAAIVSNSIAGDYTSFVNNALSLSDANYTIVGGSVLAKILPESPTVPVTPTPSVAIPELTTKTPELTLPTTPEPIITQHNAPTPQANTSSTTSQDTSNTTTMPDNSKSASNSPSASSAAQHSDSTGAMGATQDGIVVSMVQEPSAQGSGMVSVLVPKDMIMRTGGFSFALPEKVATTDTSALNITTMGGDPLPSWLQFNPATKTFTATAVPAGGLPLHVVISTGDTQVTIVIGERT